MSPQEKTAKARERAKVYSTQHRGLSYREVNGGRTYLGFIPGRGRVKLQASTYTDAVAEYSEMRGKVAKGEKVAPASIKFSEVASAWMESKDGRLRETTRRGYQDALDNEIIPVFGHRKLRDIRVDDVAAYIRKLEKRGLSTSTIDNYCKPLSGTFRYAVRRGMISQNPMAALTRDDRPVNGKTRKAYEWTTEEIDNLLLAADIQAKEPSARADYTLLLRVAVYAGLRLGEILGLQWGDIDFEEGTILVQRQYAKTGDLVEPKTAAAVRRVPIRAELVQALRLARMASGHSKDSDFVFGTKDGKPRMHRVVQRGFTSIRDKAKLPTEITFHDLRHAFASIAVQAGADVVYLSKVIGHTDPAITLRVYSHVFDRANREQDFRRLMAERVAWR